MLVVCLICTVLAIAAQAQPIGNIDNLPSLKFAQREFEKGLREFPKHTPDRDDFRWSLFRFSTALVINPENSEFYFFRGITYGLYNAPELALRDFALARFYGYDETKIAAQEAAVYKNLNEKPIELTAFLETRSDKVKKDVARMPGLPEQFPFCKNENDCVTASAASLKEPYYYIRQNAVYTASAALRRNPRNSAALALRAAAYNYMMHDPFDDKDYEGATFCDLALRDIRTAVALDPNLSRGNANPSTSQLWEILNRFKAPAVARCPASVAPKVVPPNSVEEEANLTLIRKRMINALLNPEAENKLRPANRAEAETRLKTEKAVAVEPKVKVENQKSDLMSDDLESFSQQPSSSAQNTSSSTSDSQYQNRGLTAYYTAMQQYRSARANYTDAVDKYNRNLKASPLMQGMMTGTVERAKQQLSVMRSALSNLIKDHGKHLPADKLKEVQQLFGELPSTPF